MAKKELFLFLGPGGVGKTTLSAYTAVSSAKAKLKVQSEQKIKLITIDPSKRLKDFFEMGIGDSNKTLYGNLEVSLNQRDQVFQDFLEDSLSEQDLKKLSQNKIIQAILDDLSISQEFTSLYELWKSHNDSRWSQIIVDTPPVQNSSDFLAASLKLKALFSSSVVKLFLAGGKSGLFNKIIFQTRELVFKALKKLTGADFVDELRDFFYVSQKIREKIITVLEESHQLIRQADIRMVCAYSELSLLSLDRALKNFELPVSTVYVNKFLDDENRPVERDLYKKIRSDYPTIDFITIPKSEKDLSQLDQLLEEFGEK